MMAHPGQDPIRMRLGQPLGCLVPDQGEGHRVEPVAAPGEVDPHHRGEPGVLAFSQQLRQVQLSPLQGPGRLPEPALLLHPAGQQLLFQAAAPLALKQRGPAVGDHQVRQLGGRLPGLKGRICLLGQQKPVETVSGQREQVGQLAHPGEGGIAR